MESQGPNSKDTLEISVESESNREEMVDLNVATCARFTKGVAHCRRGCKVPSHPGQTSSRDPGQTSSRDPGPVMVNCYHF